MKATIDVKDRKEANAIREALDDPAVRALVVTIGVLRPLDDNARRRVLDFVASKLAIGSGQGMS